MENRTIQRSCVALLVLGSLSLAGAPNRPATRPSFGQPPIIERIEQALSDLQLTDEQKGKIQDVLKDARERLQAMHSELDKLDQQQRVQKIGPMFQQIRDDVLAVLDNDQKAQLEEKMQRFRQRMRDRERNFAPGSGATTRPGAGGGAGAGERSRPGMILERVRDNLQKLDLSAEQKAKIETLFDETKAKGQQLAEQARQGGEEVREKLRELGQESRRKLGEILTPPQQEKLRELMQADGFGPPPGERQGERAKEPGVAPPAEKKPQAKKAQSRPAEPQMKEDPAMTMMEEGARDKSKPAVSKTDTPPPNDAALLAAGPSPGDAAPDLKLQRLDGGDVRLSSFKGRITVLVFGSLTSPSFRQRAAGLEKLKDTYGSRANFYVVYGKEAHPLGEWEVNRNKDEGISIEQPGDPDARRATADKMRNALKLSASILIDTMNNDAATAFGAGANSAYVIGRDGRLVARQQWFEPAALRRYIDQAATAPAVAR